ncbi:hypothetical protein G7Z17_g13482 [Cylindrodendrum hubeiense]|uniref:AT hook domain-containing protein n=1 Tax=Cylindrodendrum hubeiense TaxID=595255 RepID=A0A9P5GVS5_9HYPO|nr:hypothetical protein G7Z17_g13482 [Cylindrodendrum hubeiense]
MPPIIIADSDDEDNSYSPSHSPQASLSPRNASAEATRSFGRVSHTTTSTDPSFFRNIYEEQNDAARENAPDRLPGSSNAAPSSSEVTAPAPFQRTVTGLIEPSSLTSISDPTATRDPKASSGKGMSDWTQISTPGRRKAPTAMMDALWDVPSSPETGHARQVPKIRLKRQDAQPTSRPAAKEILKIKPRGGSINKTEVDHDHGLDANGSPTGQRKRRKIENSHLSPQGSNEVDLVTIPFSNDNDGYPESQLAAPSSMLPPTLPPTLPVDNEASFYISAKPLTNAQKLQYQSVQIPSSDYHQDYLLPTFQHVAQMVGSSGSATNVNTPRSDGAGLSTAPMPSAVSEVDAGMATQLNDRRPPSSPDIISLIESPAKPKDARKRGRPKKASPKKASPKRASPKKVTPKKDIPKQDSPERDIPKHDIPYQDESEVAKQNEVVERDSKLDRAESPFVKAAAEDEESDYAEQPIKLKKPRGRPRKKAAEEATQPTTPIEANSRVGKATTTQKKKRGRPRKQDKLDAAEQSPQVMTEPSDNVAPVPSEPVQTKVISEALSEERSVSHEQDKPQDEEPSNPEQNTTVLKETSQNTTSSAALDKTEKDEKRKIPDSPVVEKGAKASPSGLVGKGAGQARGLSAITAASNSKPLYRVGLSKRMRIAPLLKSLRK